MERVASQARTVITFGPFTLIASERQLLREGIPVELGARTFDILVTLLDRATNVVSKRELLESVWSDVTVEEGSLRFHIAGLRKALGDGKDGARYIATLAGQGYCFVAPIERSVGPARVLEPLGSEVPYANLPNRLERMIGRDDTVQALSTALPAVRFMTVVGPGGVGKTTVAVSVGHDLLELFRGAVLFVDLGALRDASLVASIIASMLGVTVQTDDPTPGLIAHLQDRRILLILDTCEHLLETVAPLSARLVSAAPQLHILATSREALRVEGEHVYLLAPLATPPDDRTFTAVNALTFSAIQLFIDRAIASGVRLELTAADAALIAGICRRLDGLPLAIELAAGRVAGFGLPSIATLLDQRLNLLWQGQRTAPPRQQTLQATLDWSFKLLTDVERLVLRRLAVFTGHFTIEAALAVVTNAAIGPEVLIATFDSLVGKSMVAARPIGAMIRYRLLDTTLTRVLAIDLDGAERADLAARHATYYRRWLEQTGAEWPSFSSATERAPHLAVLGNVRVALEWCFGPDGDTGIGVGLAASAVPVFLAMSLLAECHRWSERAIHALDDGTRGGREEMHLQAALGMSLMFTHGENDTARAALTRSLQIAENVGDVLDQAQLLGPLHMFHTRVGDFNTALEHAKRSVQLASDMGNLSGVAAANALLGIALHLRGDLGAARTALEMALPPQPRARRARSLHLGFDHGNWASIALARALWLQGFPTQAIERARQSIEDAAGLDHPVTLSIALNWAVSVQLWTGDLEGAERLLQQFASHARSHSMGPYFAVGRGYEGELAVRRGDFEHGIMLLKPSLAQLHAARYELLSSPFNLALVEGLARAGRPGDALALADETIRAVERRGDLSYLPELLRLKGEVLLSAPGGDTQAAEDCLLQSLSLSRRQTARSWELRTATTLAVRWAEQGRPEAARSLLQPVLETFTEGLNTADPGRAAALLTRLS